MNTQTNGAGHAHGADQDAGPAEPPNPDQDSLQAEVWEHVSGPKSRVSEPPYKPPHSVWRFKVPGGTIYTVDGLPTVVHDDPTPVLRKLIDAAAVAADREPSPEPTTAPMPQRAVSPSPHPDNPPPWGPGMPPPGVPGVMNAQQAQAARHHVPPAPPPRGTGANSPATGMPANATPEAHAAYAAATYAHSGQPTYLLDDDLRAKFGDVLRKRLQRRPVTRDDWQDIRKIIDRAPPHRPPLWELFPSVGTNNAEVMFQAACEMFGMLGYTVENGHVYAPPNQGRR